MRRLKLVKLQLNYKLNAAMAMADTDWARSGIPATTGAICGAKPLMSLKWTYGCKVFSLSLSLPRRDGEWSLIVITE